MSKAVLISRYKYLFVIVIGPISVIFINVFLSNYRHHGVFAFLLINIFFDAVFSKMFFVLM